ncbi:MAG: carboxylating nicotinate-nucleotide diphosphorylase [Hyphomicrobiaceae bacterium]|nr:carboxylating nicotinate-nucleotide diphosphorylase [Hyphomicrobiaceae bacterium]
MPFNPPDLPRPIIDEMVKAALLEDLGRAGDITTQATIPPDAVAEAVFAARKDGIVCGLPFAASAFRLIGEGAAFAAEAGDGERIAPGQIVGRVAGPARLVLSAERVALNFLTHLSGIATATGRFADAIAHTKAKITCTRKTLPGLRAAQKYAVKKGGGSNHRFGLDDAILIKDNHIAVAGGVQAALDAAHAFGGHMTAVEIEVDTLAQFEEALQCGAKIVLLDNMSPATLAEAVALNRGRAVLEASGGITLETVAAVAESGVDYISSGWITASSPALDIGLDIGIS